MKKVFCHLRPYEKETGWVSVEGMDIYLPEEYAMPGFLVMFDVEAEGGFHHEIWRVDKIYRKVFPAAASQFNKPSQFIG
jgi:hypothetical protein